MTLYSFWAHRKYIFRLAVRKIMSHVVVPEFKFRLWFLPWQALVDSNNRSSNGAAAMHETDTG